MPASAPTTRIRKHLALRAALVALLVAAPGASTAKAQTFAAAPVVFAPSGSNIGLAQQVDITLTAASTIRSITIPLPLAAPPEFFLVDNGGCVEDGTTLNPAGTVCSLTVRFHPALPGLRTGSLIVTDGSGNATAIGLSGVGYYPQIALGPATARIVAGLGPTHAGYTGDGGAASAAQLNVPRGLAADSFGNLYIIDNSTATGSVVRMLDAFGNITTVAGGGTVTGSAASGAPATSAQFALISHLACDSAGNLYISDSTNNVVWRVAMSTSHLLTVVAGNFTKGYSGDGGPATAAQLSVPLGIVVDGYGKLYIADSQNEVVRAVDASGTISTFAGSGTFGQDSSPVQAASAHFASPTGLALDTTGNLYITEQSSDVRKVSAGIVSVFAGTGTRGYSGDGGPATSANLNYPSGIAVSPAGDVYISDAATDVVRKVQASDGTIETVAGDPAQAGQFTYVAGPAPSLGMNAPVDIAFDTQSNLYIVDSGNSVVRELSPVPGEIVFPPVAAGSTSAPQALKIANIGNAPLSLGNAAVANPATANNFALSGDAGTPCGSTLAPGAHCQYDVTYAPQNSSGFVTGEIDVTHAANNPNFNSIEPVYLSGGTPSPITISPTTIAAATLNQAYTANIAVSGGYGSFHIEVPASLPPGLSVTIDTNSVKLTGNPTSTGSYPFTVYAGDVVGNSAQQAYTLAVNSQMATLAVTETVHVTDTPANMASLVLAIAEAVHVTDTPNETLPLLLNVSEAIHVTDAPQQALTLLLNVNEAIHVTDTPTALLPAVLAVAEAIHVNDAPTQALSLLLNVSEAVHVSDTPTQALSLLLNVNEAIHVTDTPKTLLPAVLTVTEAIHVMDAAVQTPSLLLNVSEAIHVTDTTQALLPALLAVAETIHISDTPKQTLSLVLNVLEAIHVTDAGNNVPSALSATAESLHITDFITLTKGPAPQTITPAAISSHTYGDAPFLVSANASSGLSVTVSVTGPASLSGSTLTITGAGSITLTFTQPGNATTQPAPPVTVTFSAARATANIRALDATRVTGQPNPSFLFTLSGLVRGDSATVISGLPLITTTATASSPAGPYPITPATGTLSAANYTFSFTPGTLTLVAPTSQPKVFLVGNGSVSSLTGTGNTQSSAITAGGIGAAVDAGGFVWSIDSSGTSIAKFNSSGALVADYSTGLTGATALAIDGSGQVWITGANNTVSVLANTGTLLSTTSDSHISGVTGVAIDTSGSVWLSSGGNSTIQQIIGGATPAAPPAVGLANGTTGTRP